MKFTISLILIMLLSFAACLYSPWWSIAFVAFLVIFFIPQKPLAAFLCGFTALFLFWSAMSFWISSNNAHVLAHKVSVLFLKMDSPAMLILTTGFIGGLVAGFAALTASFTRKTEVEVVDNSIK